MILIFNFLSCVCLLCDLVLTSEDKILNQNNLQQGSLLQLSIQDKEITQYQHENIIANQEGNKTTEKSHHYQLRKRKRESMTDFKNFYQEHMYNPKKIFDSQYTSN